MSRVRRYSDSLVNEARGVTMFNAVVCQFVGLTLRRAVSSTSEMVSRVRNSALVRVSEFSLYRTSCSEASCRVHLTDRRRLCLNFCTDDVSSLKRCSSLVDCKVVWTRFAYFNWTAQSTKNHVSHNTC